MDAGKRSLDQILTGSTLLEVPFYQRGYVWGKDQWERLIEDMEFISSTDRSYFIGSIILKQQWVNSGSAQRRTIIDGQQRLTTLSIFFKVLCQKNDDTNRFDRRFRLEDGNLAIKHSRRDSEAFNAALNTSDVATLDGNDKVTQAYNYFVRHLDPSKLDIDKILNQLQIVVIDLGLDEDEQQIFDTINSLGVRLTTAELLKNYFFQDNDLEDYKTYWENVFEKDTASLAYWEKEINAGRFKRTLVDLFFYSFLQIKIQDKELSVDAKDKLLFGKYERLFESYKHLVGSGKYEIDKTEFLVEMRQYAELFRKIIDPGSIDQPIEPTDAVNRINNVIFGLDASILIAYLLFVVQRNGNDQESLSGILNAVESYMVRRVIVRASTKELGSLFGESLILNDIYTREAFNDYVLEKSDKSLFFPSNSQLKFGIENSKLTNSHARGVLYLLESSVRDYARNSNSLLGLKKYSLEHLMPKKWENKWGQLESIEATEARNNKLLTLGNLAIITQSLNANINDADWQTKLNGRGSHRGLKAYASGIETLSTYLELPAWDESTIQERADNLYDQAISVWPAGE